MKYRNRTLANNSKRVRLDKEHVLPKQGVKDLEAVTAFVRALEELEDVTTDQILYSIGVELLEGHRTSGIYDLLNRFRQDEVDLPPVPRGEEDLLGVVYQYLSSKSDNLKRGSFYTGWELAREMTEGLTFDNGERIFDPACGSGMLLLQSNAGPHQIAGVDNDRTAVMIAKFNFFLKFPDAAYPRIFHADFFEWCDRNLGQEMRNFDYIVGNPPYGAELARHVGIGSSIFSGESFSHFISQSSVKRKKGGKMRFLVPESLLNVKKHRDIRALILSGNGGMNLVRIKQHHTAFSGVMSNIYQLDFDESAETEDVVFEVGSEQNVIPKAMFGSLKNSIFSNLSQQDLAIIEKVRGRCDVNLRESTFGLGIVTGRNKEVLSPEMRSDHEEIFTGKEIDMYHFLPAKNFIRFNRAELQQVAPDEIYRSPEKLVYKTISKKLLFVIDRSGSLTTNSANIVIPRVEDNTIETIAALLNSDLYDFLNIKLFGGVNKVSRENLSSLPLPRLTEKQIEDLVLLVNSYSGDNSKINNYINSEIFNLTQLEVEYIETM